MSSQCISPRILLLAVLAAFCATPAFAQFVITTPDLPDGAVGQPYSASLQSIGGIAPINYSIPVGSGALPPGITLSSAGVFSGTPTSSGFYNFIVQAVDSPSATTPQVTTRSFSIYVAAVITIAPAALPQAVVNVPFSVQLSASGGTPPYFYEFDFQSPTPPPSWLNLSSAGFLTGTAPTQGSFTFGVVVWDTSESFAARTYTLTVNPALAFTTPSLASATTGQSYSSNLAATGGIPPYTFSLFSGSLPAGLSLNSAGLISGTPTGPSFTTLIFRVADSQGNSTTRSYTLDVQPPPLSFTPSTLPHGEVGLTYSASFTPSGVGSTYTFSVLSGTLPPGLTLSTGGVVSGTPTSAGTFTFVVRLNSMQSDLDQTVTVTIYAPLQLSPSSLPAGRINAAYNATLLGSGGQPPYQFAVRGSLPAGITFANGVFGGAPSQVGVFDFTVVLSDSGGRTVERSYSILVPTDLKLVTEGPLASGTVGSPYSTTFTASEGITPYTWTASGNVPPGLTLNSASGVLSGTPTTAGQFTFEVRVSDPTTGSATKSFQITVVLPPLSAVTYTQVGSTAPPGQQPRFGIHLAQPYPAPLTGAVNLGFAADRFGDDPSIQFSNGSRSMPFTIQAGQQDADFGSVLAALQTGTVAGTITLTARLSVNQQDVTPSPAPTHTIRVAAVAPVITKLELSKVAGGFELIVTGYSTPRQMTTAVVKLTAASGSSLASSEFAVDLANSFSSYYSGSASAPYGSQFRLVIPFYVPQGLNGIASASVTLTNSAGTSAASSVSF